MKKFQRLLGILLVSAASAGLFVACGDNGDDSCITSEDCASDELCNLDTDTCGFACTPGDDICTPEETCDTSAAAEEGRGVCVVTDDGGGDECTVETQETDCEAGEVCEAGSCVAEDGPECTDNEDCEGDQLCNEEGVCETIDASSYFFTEIVDISDESNDALCGADLPDPGSDIFGVELTADGTTYWAEWSSVAGIKTENNDLASPGTDKLDGNPPSLTAGNCPEAGFSDSVVALGCGGSIIVQFTDDEGNRVEITDGDTITVYEYGQTCQANPDPSDPQDQYTVNLCEAGTGDDCVEPLTLNSGTGVAPFTVEIQQM